MIVELPSECLATYIFKIANDGTGIKELTHAAAGSKTYYDLQGRRLAQPKGLCIEQNADGTSRKVFIQ